jgi:hypothetical protein
MESILWALDLFAVVILCFWALRVDSADKSKAKRVDRERY